MVSIDPKSFIRCLPPKEQPFQTHHDAKNIQKNSQKRSDMDSTFTKPKFGAPGLSNNNPRPIGFPPSSYAFFYLDIGNGSQGLISKHHLKKAFVEVGKQESNHNRPLQSFTSF